VDAATRSAAKVPAWSEAFSTEGSVGIRRVWVERVDELPRQLQALLSSLAHLSACPRDCTKGATRFLLRPSQEMLVRTEPRKD